MDPIIEWARELQSLAQAGLYYEKNVFELERYQRIRDIATEMLASRVEIPPEKVKDLFCSDIGYQTPKIDTRAAVFDGNCVLLVRERDGTWSMPGGWCDYNLSPAENAIKEAREEAGLEVTIEKLVAIQDRDKHNLPPYIYKIVKVFFLCSAVGGAFIPNSETSDSGYFPIDHLPPLSEARTSAEQIRMCHEASQSTYWQTRFD